MKSRFALAPLWRWSKWMIVTLSLLAVTSGCMASSNVRPMPKAEQGVIDLREWSWNEDGIVPLDGQWKFEWFPPSGNDNPKSSSVLSTLEVPGTWGSMKTGNGFPLQDQGYGIYRLSILHESQRDMMAIRLPNISTAYELYIDNQIVITRGHISQSASETLPFQLPATVYFKAQNSQTDLKLVVANFDHRRGGIRTALVMGNADHIQKLQIRHAAQELIILGCLIMIGFYHLGLYILRRKEVANMMFALLCLFVGLRMGLIGEGYIVQWIQAFNWDLATRFEYIAFVMSGWAGFGYFQAMYPLEIKRIWFKISSAIAALLILCVLTVPPLIFTSWILAFQLYIILFSVRVLAGLVLSGLRHREGAKLALIGVAGLVLTIVNDMLFYNGWWRSTDLVPFGLLFLIVMNSFIISLRFSLTYERAELMSAELTEWNNSLEERIAERTDELQRSNVTLENATIELERMEKSRTQLVSNISHDLRTPITLLQGYLEALRDQVISEPEQRDNTIRLMLTKVEGLNSLIQDLFDLSVLEARKVELTLEDIPLTDWKERLMEQYELEMQAKQISFHCELAGDYSQGTTVSIDIRRMDRVFANLLYNAVRFTPQGGSIAITMTTLPDQRAVEIVVEDSGAGLDPEDLPYLFDRFYKKDKSRHSSTGGSGLGLSIAKEIVELHGGEIRAYNAQEGGSVFEMILPMSS
ncbi:sensor histidine kinase [Cohnella silvisoli]|uniref:histidine kinase n=1 Tax=Cohnella silvisoli TaxID=2873699 RepID=A0ABV1KNJ1_9BACL|nr:sensor histidine kinase [Cohnella silvisoli]MCD9021078.1 sensor histidine kinase [Cohnella silvisoli]